MFKYCIKSFALQSSVTTLLFVVVGTKNVQTDRMNAAMR